jgi:hypothetical protein
LHKPTQANQFEQLRGIIKNLVDEVRVGTLTVVGAVYDCQNLLGQGQGRLVTMNINGAEDSHHVSAKLFAVK